VIKPIQFKTTHRASFQEIDSYGHLNTLHYVSYFLSHRFTALRERFELDMKSISELEIAFYTKNLEVAFIRPILGDQLFAINSLVSEKGDGDCKVSCEMLDSKDRTLAKCVMHLVCIDKNTGKPTKWPEGFMDRFYE